MTATSSTISDTGVPKDERSMTIKEFCALERMSLATYFKFQRNGVGPNEVRGANGMRFVRITPSARREWHLRMNELQQGQAVELEHQRRVEMCRRAGKKAAQSVCHVSKRGKRSA